MTKAEAKVRTAEEQPRTRNTANKFASRLVLLVTQLIIVIMIIVTGLLFPSVISLASPLMFCLISN